MKWLWCSLFVALSSCATPDSEMLAGGNDAWDTPPDELEQKDGPSPHCVISCEDRPPCHLGYDAVVEWGTECFCNGCCEFISCVQFGDNIPYVCGHHD